MTNTVIGNTNGFRAMKSLQAAARDPRIEEIEGGGMDDGRVFLHARIGWRFEGETRSRSVGNAAEIRDAIRTLRADTPEHAAAAIMGRLGGSVKSTAKAKAARANGAKGGRPRTRKAAR